jgi:hypothetical protein
MRTVGLKHYVLVDKRIIAIDTLEEWMAHRIKHPNDDPLIEVTQVGDMTVSTVFLPIDHNHFSPGDPPILFETMIFGGWLDEEQHRCSTYAEAEKMHAQWVREAEDVQKQLDKLALIATVCDLGLPAASS